MSLLHGCFEEKHRDNAELSQRSVGPLGALLTLHPFRKQKEEVLATECRVPAAAPAGVKVVTDEESKFDCIARLTGLCRRAATSLAAAAATASRVASSSSSSSSSSTPSPPRPPQQQQQVAAQVVVLPGEVVDDVTTTTGEEGSGGGGGGGGDQEQQLRTTATSSIDMASSKVARRRQGSLPKEPPPVNDDDVSREYTVDNFEIVKTIGTGTFGRVCLCREKATKTYYALKVLAIADVVRLKQVEHVRNEKRVLGMSLHPFIIQM
ncbi:unnamed protein product [Notodromas monacha]|uniref:Protein kinase domain-containing protein n=1 Tax=Notodromas monacha TaxID=399045 RepID=A0A7R9GHY7_9CRUS|nr:unnamed protein product [Notodromas monacha]CAG0922021.1 unnamed protein product [Notodromas monacha]